MPWLDDQRHDCQDVEHGRRNPIGLDIVGDGEGDEGEGKGSRGKGDDDAEVGGEEADSDGHDGGHGREGDGYRITIPLLQPHKCVAQHHGPNRDQQEDLVHCQRAFGDNLTLVLFELEDSAPLLIDHSLLADPYLSMMPKAMVLVLGLTGISGDKFPRMIIGLLFIRGDRSPGRDVRTLNNTDIAVRILLHLHIGHGLLAEDEGEDEGEDRTGKGTENGHVDSLRVWVVQKELLQALS